MIKNTKDKILKTAFYLFLEKGYKSTTYSELITASDLSKGSFYHYFKNKEELFQAVIDTYFLSYFNAIEWDKVDQMDYSQVERSIKDYYNKFVIDIEKLSGKGMNRYIILFFETLEIYPLFRETLRDFYRRLEKTISEKNPDKNQSARDIIAQYEGLIFWKAIFPEDKLNKQ